MKSSDTAETLKYRGNVLVYVIDLLVLVILIWLDQFTKRLAVSHLMNQKPYVLVKDVLQLRYLENRGAAFGMLQNQKWFFICIGALFLIVIGIALFRIPTTKKYTALRACLVLIAAGAVGNMIDRTLYEYVIDFIYFIYINFPIFNVADIYVTVATFLLIILILFFYKDDDLNLKKARTVKIHSSLREQGEEKKENAD